MSCPSPDEFARDRNTGNTRSAVRADLESRRRWVEYSKAKDEMFAHTDIKASPWYVVTADSKKHARLNCITHMLSLIPYDDSTPEPVELEPRPKAKSDAV